jgi:hypothetical protein
MLQCLLRVKPDNALLEQKISASILVGMAVHRTTKRDAGWRLVAP